MTAQAGDTSACSPAAQKQLLRRRLRLQRRQLPSGFRHAAERRALRHLLALPELRKARRIAIYLAVASEFPTRRLAAALLQSGREVYAPVARIDGALSFRRLRRIDRLQRDTLGLPCPPGPRATLPAHALNVVITPLVGFDGNGGRLGAGGGYYDRSFAFRRQRPAKVRLIGLAFETQRVDAVPAEPWDLRLDAIVTERGVHRPHRH